MSTRELELDILAAACASDLSALAALKEGLLSREVADAVEALLQARGDVRRALTSLAREGKHAGARALEEAAFRTPPASVDCVLGQLMAARALERWRVAAQRILRVCSSDLDPEEALRQVQAAVSPAMYYSAASGGVLPLSRILDEFVSEYRPGEVGRVVPSGIACVDGLSGGWRKGHFHLIGGLTGTGKTTMLIQSAVAAAGAGCRVHLVSCEIPPADLVPRFVGSYLESMCCPDGSVASVGRLVRKDPEMFEVLLAVRERVREEWSRILVDARGWIGLQDAVSAFLAHHAASPVDLLLVDYLQLLNPARRQDRREREVAESAEVLKRVAMQHDVAVVAAAQLVDPPAWAPEHRRSQGAAVRESRAAAHAADMVIEIYPDPDDDPEEASGGRYRAYLLRFAKSRHFPSGMTSRLLFDTVQCRFLSGGRGWQQA